MKHELIVKVEPLGPPKRKTEKPADLDDVWYPVPGKPDFEVNGRGQLRTKVDLPPAAPAPAYSFVGEPIRLHYSTGQELRPVRSAAARKVWFADGKYHEMEIDLEQPIEPPITDSAAYRSLWGYWSADVVNRVLKDLELNRAAERERRWREYWGRSIPAMLGDAVAPPTTGSGLQLLMNAARDREQRGRQVGGYWSTDVVNRILKEFEPDDPVIKVV